MGIHQTYEKKFVRVNSTSDGDNTVISGVAGKSIYVLGYAVGANAAGVITFQDTAASPVIYATFEFNDGGGASYAGSEGCPAFKVTKGEGLEVSNAAGVDTTGHLTYIVAPA